MTDRPSRRARMRALIEDPTWHHPRDIGRELDLDAELRGVPRDQIQQFDDLEAAQPRNLLAQTKVAPRPLELTLDVAELNARTGQQFVAVIHTDAELDAAIAAALEDR